MGQDAVQFSYFFGQVGGWVVGEMEIKANLSLSLVEVEAELGNKDLNDSGLSYLHKMPTFFAGVGR